MLVDLPGTYSLISNSQEEEIARNYICSGQPDVTVVVVDATCLERNLNLVYQTMELTPNVIVCVNLLDEAKKKGIFVDLKALSLSLGVPVVGTIARKPKTLKNLLSTIHDMAVGRLKASPILVQSSEVVDIIQKAEYVAKKVCVFRDKNCNARDRRIDKILTSKKFGIPIMLLFLGLIFWITIIGANYPSQVLSNFFAIIEEKLIFAFDYFESPEWLKGIFIDGVYRTLSWVIAVMLPPMAIFFPLFTFLEDLGYLPRIAFNLDKCFKKCCTSGKQALTMCMGFGCNAAGVVGCRIIDSPRERLIAILTNNFVPCNRKISFFNNYGNNFHWKFFCNFIFIYCIYSVCSVIDIAWYLAYPCGFKTPF